MPMVSLPFSDWEIRADEIVICKRPDGKDWCLGEGSAGTVGSLVLVLISNIRVV